MSFSFIDIEERKKRLVSLFFALLVLFYFFSIWVLAVTIKIVGITFGINLHPSRIYLERTISLRQYFLLTPLSLLVIFFVALIVGFFHWYFSTSKIKDNLLALLKARHPDKNDRYHRRLQNIIDEVSVATGGRKFECVVIPTIAMNAFSIDDLQGRAVIGVTEGALSRLNRAQLEAVVAHEAAHIVSGDSLIKSIAVSIFGIYESILDKLKETIEKSGESSYERRGVHPSIIVLFIVAAILRGLGKFISMFVSRQCEYRADAVAVRLTREPFSLAQGLYRISKKWRGGGSGYESLESLFIMNPNFSKLDEEEGLFANLFSTHPPVRKRIGILLNIAHSDFSALEKEATAFKRPRHKEVKITTLKEPKWFIVNQNKWQGPFFIKELIGSGILRHESFIRRDGGNKITLAYQDKELLRYLRDRNSVPGRYQCPRCYKSLDKALYEGTSVYSCSSCKGILLEGEKTPRILTREEQGFTEEVIRGAKEIQNMAKRILTARKIKMENELPCPKCKRIMDRGFYSLAFPIEVDRCYHCNHIWFDENELEILQYLVEKEHNR